MTATVNVWIVNHKGEILCSRRSGLYKEPGKWQSFFGGHLENNEDFKMAAMRELHEEIGLKINPKRLYLIEKGHDDNQNRDFESYAYLFDDNLAVLKIDKSEIVDLKWFSLDDYWRERNAHIDKWCNGCKPENQEKIKEWLRNQNKFINILGVEVSKTNLEQARQLAREFLNSNEQRKIFTPNPEMIVKAQKDEYFKKVLNSGDVNLCDGFGLALFSGAPRVTGVDFMLDICKIAEEMGEIVYLLGSANNDVIKKTAEELKKMFPNINIGGYDKGPFINENFSPYGGSPEGRQSINNLTIQQFNNFGLLIDEKDNEVLINRINSSGAAVIFVAFGMGKQEKWIYENLAKMPSVKIAMGVGGAFDYISGNVKRAPCWMRKIGLEWVYRLFIQPKRVGRMFNATTIFLYYLLTKR